MIRQLYKGRIVDLRLERVTLPNGTEVELELMQDRKSTRLNSSHNA